MSLAMTSAKLRPLLTNREEKEERQEWALQASVLREDHSLVERSHLVMVVGVTL